MAARKLIVPKSMQTLYETRQYAPGLISDKFLFVAGQVGRDADLNVIADREAQMVQTFENLKMVLKAGGCGFDDLVEVVTYLTDLPRDIALFREVKSRYIKRNFPPFTVIGCTALAVPGLICEVRVIARVPAKRPKKKAPAARKR